MAKKLTPSGNVINGDYTGCYVYYYDTANFCITNAILKSGLFVGTQNVIVKFINSDNVERIEDISGKLTSTAGIVVQTSLRILGGKAVPMDMIDVAVYFKDGEKCVIRFGFRNDYHIFKSMMYEL